MPPCLPLISGLACSYTKFLIGRDGRVYGRYLPRTRPAQLEASIQELLAEAPGADGSTGDDEPAGACARWLCLLHAGACSRIKLLPLLSL